MVLLLLPGMDGTGLLFGALQRALPSRLRTVAVDYPRDRVQSYAQLLASLPIPNEPFAVIAESFSGPLGIQLAAHQPPNLQALILAASFARRPRRVPSWLIRPAASVLFSLPPPAALLRRSLLGHDASTEAVEQLQTVLRSVPPQILAHRLQSIFEVDVREELRRIPVPLLLLRAKFDKLVPSTAVSEMAELCTHAHVVTIDGSHLLLQEQSVVAARIIVDFLDSIGIGKHEA